MTDLQALISAVDSLSSDELDELYKHIVQRRQTRYWLVPSQDLNEILETMRPVHEATQDMTEQEINDVIDETLDDILRQDRLRIYDRARHYWQSVNDDRQHLSNEKMDSQFWLIDHNGIPRLKSEQANVVLSPDPLEQMLKLAEADHSIQWRTKAKRKDDGGKI
jgi:hypothetical protein